MRQSIKAFRYFVSTLAVSAALGLVCFAQQAAPKAIQGAAATSVATDQISVLVADWTRARDYTKEYLDVMPEDGLSLKPTPDIRSFAEQMVHLASANFGFISTAAGIANPYQGKDPAKMEELKTKAGLTKFVIESYDFVISAAKGVDVKKLNEPIKLFGRFETTRGGAWNKAFEHQTHHRGQTTIYIRLKGIKPPNERLF
jgi:uncharacterized damage-inducible protein DinB